MALPPVTLLIEFPKGFPQPLASYHRRA